MRFQVIYHGRLIRTKSRIGGYPKHVKYSGRRRRARQTYFRCNLAKHTEFLVRADIVDGLELETDLEILDLTASAPSRYGPATELVCVLPMPDPGELAKLSPNDWTFVQAGDRCRPLLVGKSLARELVAECGFAAFPAVRTTVAREAMAPASSSWD